MTKASELAERIAEVTGLEPTTVARYARFAREGRYLSQSGRGNSAARMRPVDAVNLLACVLVNGVAQEAPDQIKRVMEMDVGSRDADHLDERHMDEKEYKALRKLFPIVFNRRHTLHELLVEAMELAAMDPEKFEERFYGSTIYFSSDEYDAFIDFQIRTDDNPLNAKSFSLTYAHQDFQKQSEYFRRSTQLSFAGIARIGALLAKP